MSQIAQIIADQIGGRAFFMLGASEKMGSEKALTFKVGKNSKSVSHIRVTLEPSDTYKVEAIRVRRSKGVLGSKVLEEQQMVYVDSLHRVIEAMTGLRTSL
jgi:hypothetical protein